MKVRVFPPIAGFHYGNIKWPGVFRMNRGVFPKNHPVGGGFCDSGDGQCGNGENIKAFRALGYWASCFPEGDGITWEACNGQSDAQCLTDIRQAFGWDADWGMTPRSDSESQKGECP